MELEDFIKEGTGVDYVSEMWFCSKGDLLSGLQQIKCDKDILMLCSSVRSRSEERRVGKECRL